MELISSSTSDSVRMDYINADIKEIINSYTKLLFEAQKSIIPIKSKKIYGLKHFADLYIRARAGKCWGIGIDVLVVSSISVSKPGNGVFKSLLSSLKILATEKSYLLKIESVINLGFRDFLCREGFVFPGDPSMCGSGYWAPSHILPVIELEKLPS